MACHTLESLLANPHLGDVGLRQKVEHPTQGTSWNIGAASTMTSFAPTLRHHAPHIGQQTAEVLQEYGYSHAQIEQLLADGAAFVGQA
jgi:crotonobetainyl-CoA:carnitine CoA-transferase CaiB-like acyl-CoA transferase